MMYFLYGQDSRSKEVDACGRSSGKLPNTERRSSAAASASSSVKSRTALLAI